MPSANVVAVVPKIWSAAFLRILERRNIWLGLMNRMYEGEIRSAGDRVVIPTFTGTVAVKDYTPNTNIADPELVDTTTQELAISEQKYFHIYVDDIDRVQARPDLMEAFMTTAAIEISEEIDNFCENLYTGTAVAASRLLTIGSSSALEKGGTIAGNKTAIEKLLFELPELKRKMFEAKIVEAPNGFSLIVTPEVFASFERYFMLSSTASEVLAPRVIRGTIDPRLNGFNIVRTSNLPKTADKHQLIATNLVAGSFISQITEMVPYRPEKRFGDAIKALYVYGGKIVDDCFRWGIDFHFDYDGT